jgi:uncharacterized protein (TIGR00369 family)
MSASSALTTLAKQVLAAQPFNTLVGAELASIEEGKAELRIPIKKELLQQNGFVHGGVLSYAADNAITFAGGSVLGAAVVTSEYKINYLRPAVGSVLRVEAKVISRTKRLAVCSCEVFAEGEAGAEGGEPRLCAVAFGSVSVLESRGG